jgi:hypothetical protein
MLKGGASWTEIQVAVGCSRATIKVTKRGTQTRGKAAEGRCRRPCDKGSSETSSRRGSLGTLQSADP